MNSTLKRYLVSSIVTFISAFTVTFLSVIQTPSFTFSKASLLALATSSLAIAIRAAAKALQESITGTTTDVTPTSTSIQG